MIDIEAKVAPAFELVPGFIRFILDNALEEYVHTQLRISRKMNLPILKYFENIPEEQLIALSMVTSAEFLEYIAENRLREHLTKTLNDWTRDQLPNIGKGQIELDDLLLITAVRKKSLMQLLPSYTTDLDSWKKIIEELDSLFLSYDRASTSTFVRLLQEKLLEETFLSEKLSFTCPGFNYIYDIKMETQVLPAEKLFNFLGYSEEEYKGQVGFFKNLMHPDDLILSRTYLENLQRSEGNEVFSFEYRVKDKSGEYRWMRNYESIFKRDHSGLALQLIGIAFDVSKEHYFNEELKHREEQLLEAQELAQMGSYYYDFISRSSTTTPQTVAILGLRKGEKFDQFMERIHPSDKPKVEDALQQALRGEKDYECEYRCQVNGIEKIIWSRGKVVFKNGQAFSMKGTVMDVTDKHYMVQKLQRSEELYKQAQALNKIGNWTWEISKDNLQWSDELYRIYGLAPQSEKISFDRFVSFIHEDDREKRLEHLQNQMNIYGVSEYIFKIVAANGEIKVLYGQSEVLRDEQGIPYKIIGTCQDVSKQKELENTLFQKTVQLESTNQSLEQFAYICSHDLREPLRKISVLSDRLQGLVADRLDEKETKILDKIMNASMRLQHMINDILSVSGIDRDEKIEKVELKEVLNESLQTIDIDHSQVTIEVGDLPAASVNPIQFRQLFMNLVTNAVKFRKEGRPSVIRVDASSASEEQVLKLNLDKNKKYLSISIADNGIGFETSYADKIFGIFQRLHDRTRYEGNGIGLAICKKIVEHHHGGIYAVGEPGEGATFFILIPQ
jgi:PAS domain S-box-containing protein